MSLREWAPCSAIVEAVPSVVIGTLIPQAVRLGRIDACREHVALAPDKGGVVYWYDRGDGSVRRLRCENSRSTITALKIVSTVDFMVAVGNAEGQINAFQIPKPKPEGYTDTYRPPSDRVERYSISDSHKSPISSLEWSKNGTKLFSGDKEGVVVLTEIDFYMHICKSYEIVNESYEIVQLSHYRDNLLVSSLYRAIICHKSTSKWTVDQIGKKDRKNLCRLGGIIHHNYDRPTQVDIFSARPGLRMWTSDDQGNVLKTLLFKEAVMNPLNQVNLLNPSNKKCSTSGKDINFGPLLVFQDKYIVTYNDDLLYILDPEKLVAIATVDKLPKILSVAANKDEIFVLIGERTLIRIAFEPDLQLINLTEKLMTKSLFSPINAAVNSLKDLANSDAVSRLSGIRDILKDPTESAYPDDTVVSGEECFELPPVKELTMEMDDSELQQLNFNIEVDPSKLSNACEDFDDIKCSEEIIRSRKKYKRTSVVMITDNVEPPSKITPGNHFETDAIKMNKSNLMNVSYCTQSRPSSIFSDERSPESIEKDIRDMEEKLAKALNLEPITASSVKNTESHSCTLNTEEIHNDESKNFNPINPEISNIKNQIVPPEPPTITNMVEKEQKNELVSQNPKAKKIKYSNPMDFTPQCVSIPDQWKLDEIKVKLGIGDQKPPYKPERNGLKKNNAGQIFDADWELI